MDMETKTIIASLRKALEAGNGNVRPSNMVQGTALGVENLDDQVKVVTWNEKKLKLVKYVGTQSYKAVTIQFTRQLSYGIMGGSAQLEGNVGSEETSEYARITVPMAYYSHFRRTTDASNMIETLDGKTMEARAAEDAAKKLMGDIEFDSFRGADDYSHAGVFDGDASTMPEMPGMHGLFVQVRQSDSQRNARDLMFSEFGSDESVVLPVGDALTQEIVEDSKTRAEENNGDPDMILVAPRVKAGYNKLAFGWQRIVLGGSAQTSSGADLDKQFTAHGEVPIESSHWLRGKYKEAPTRVDSPNAPTISLGAATVSGTVTPFLTGETYYYKVSAINEKGESVSSAQSSQAISTPGDVITVTITPSGTGTVARAFVVYRGTANSQTLRFIGKVKNSGAATTAFTDLGNKEPAFTTGALVEWDTMKLCELAGFTRKKLATADLTECEAYYRFLGLKVTEPRKNVLLDNLVS